MTQRNLLINKFWIDLHNFVFQFINQLDCENFPLRPKVILMLDEELKIYVSECNNQFFFFPSKGTLSKT